ncbi:hypothetical protein, partial [Lysinibacillus sp. D4B1_S16]|uniref:hypothetical protein n=1 Tax=Lysinibacillus sp. D4B1_S16 TaxID=2941231 RepID=UPI0020C0105B
VQHYSSFGDQQQRLNPINSVKKASQTIIIAQISRSHRTLLKIKKMPQQIKTTQTQQIKLIQLKKVVSSQVALCKD